MTSLITVAFNGMSYGVLLFVMAVGLSVTMGMMQFVNLAHVSLSMLGGYVMVMAMDSLGLPFLFCLPLSFLAVAFFSVLLERAVLRHFYGSDDLTQVLLTLGLTFMSVATAAFIWGPTFKTVKVPDWLVGQIDVAGLQLERYRLFLLTAGALIAGLLVIFVEKTKFGAMVRACVDNKRAASGSGINTEAVFAMTFALGGGLAGLGGALSVNLLSLDPSFPLRHLVYVLIVVSVGGMGNITGSLLAGLLIGVGDVIGKYYIPEFGGLFIYLLTVLIMLCRPQGLLGIVGRNGKT